MCLQLLVHISRFAAVDGYPVPEAQAVDDMASALGPETPYMQHL
jgi:hypothetical protein